MSNTAEKKEPQWRSITADDWAAIEKALNGLYDGIILFYQDTTILLRRERVSECSLQVIVYINGSFNFSWGWPSSENYNPLVEKLWRKRQRAVCSPTEKKKIEKIFGKRKAIQTFKKLHDKTTWYDPLFPKASTLIRQLKKLDGLMIED